MRKPHDNRATKLRGVKVLDLFSGIGGFSLGLERVGMETIAFCEIEDYPVSILNKHWPEIPVHRDIRKLDGKQYRGTVGLICGGFPCQPFSVAGKRAGEADDRHLWPEMFRIIREVRPDWVIGENVAGFITMALDDVLSDMEGEGYTCQTFVIPACAVGGIHRRDRVWIIGYAENLHSNVSGIHGKHGKSKIPESGNASSENVANTTSQSANRYPGRKEKKYSMPGNSGGGTSEFRPVPIPTESPVRRRDDGLPDNVARLKALGNAVVPQIPELIGRAIMVAETKQLDLLT